MPHYQPQGKVITCILPKGIATGVMEKLHERGVTRQNFAFARGFDIHDEPQKSGIPKEVEKEILTVICNDEKEADETFQFLYEAAKIGRLGGGLMYMSQLTGAQLYALPDVPMEEA